MYLAIAYVGAFDADLKLGTKRYDEIADKANNSISVGKRFSFNVSQHRESGPSNRERVDGRIRKVSML